MRQCSLASVDVRDLWSKHDIHTKFHGDWYRCSSNIKVWPQQFESSNVGITVGRVFFFMYAIEMGLGCVLYVPGFMMISLKI
jgi:hypothetical protein